MKMVQTFYEEKFSGLLAAVIVGLAAVFLSEHYGGPTMVFALLLGISLNFLSDHERCRQGIDLAAKKILRVGVAFLGLRISFEAVGKLGVAPVVLVVVGVILTMFLGFLLTRTMKTNCAFGCLTGGAVAICGASAAMALSSVLPQGEDRERDTIFTVVTVTAFSTIAMVTYPVIASLLHFDHQQTGIFFGATIHDVAQVVGAGYSVSDETGDVATIVKLLRVAMLLPVVLCVMTIVRFRFKKESDEKVKLPFPWFVLGFVALVTLNSTVEIPSTVVSGLNEVSRWCIVTAVSALGMKTSFGALIKVGWMPVMVVLSETVFLAALCIGAIFIFGM
ncbi:MAG: YeiH family putative sulfate export transporter [Methylocystaceae bacterium]|nr:YeiH family putative sulfate export transporter [Methylocystaceae bacterium]